MYIHIYILYIYLHTNHELLQAELRDMTFSCRCSEMLVAVLIFFSRFHPVSMLDQWKLKANDKVLFSVEDIVILKY